MDSAKLIKAREYYDLVKGGAAKKDAALTVYGKKSYPAEETPEFLAIVSAASQIEKQELRKEIEQLKRKQIKTYSDLLDKGAELMEEASTIEEKTMAQANQRANLGAGVLDEAIGWDSEDRNQNDLGDVLEGVIV